SSDEKTTQNHGDYDNYIVAELVCVPDLSGEDTEVKNLLIADE
ncbi:29073_t:CDS:2, partial [Gigaspora margarita]